MYIKAVVVDGFKSYAQRTEITGFDPQFNAITGLNGSGKSNILDSICFLLGISNLSQVRASSLQELVYKGGQAGVTKATVTITFDNSDKQQSPVGYEMYDELTVSRQVVIGGRNKYLINGTNATPSRVQDLFRSVQLNVNNPHFLIMQGRITKVLNMKPPELLSMLEEAAGTRMYESKRAAAQKTIEKKDSKLKEIDAVLAEEIMPTLKKLKEERSSFLSYQKIIQEIEHLSRLHVAHQFMMAEEIRSKSSAELDSLKQEVATLKQFMVEAEENVAQLHARIATLQAKREKESKSILHGLEKAVDEHSRIMQVVGCLAIELEQYSRFMVSFPDRLIRFAFNQALAVAETTLTHSQEQMAKETDRCDTVKRACADENTLLSAKEAELEQMRQILQELEEQSVRAEEAMKVAKVHFQAVSAGMSTGADGQAETLAQQKMACENQISTAGTEVKQAQMRLKSHKAELQEKEKAWKESEKAYKKERESLDKAESEMTKLASEMEALNYAEGTEEELIRQRDTLLSEVAVIKKRIEGMEARFPQLQFEYSNPTPGFDCRKVKGPVAKLVRLKDPSTATALEVTAGGKLASQSSKTMKVSSSEDLYNIVVDTEETGKSLLQKGQLKRRYTIIPLNKIVSRTIPIDKERKAVALTGKDCARPALSLVGYEEDVRASMAYVFGTTIICDTMENAKKVTFDKSVLTRTVTLAGDVFDPSGTLTGGSRSSSASVLVELQKLLEAETELEEKERQLADVIQQLQKVQKTAAKYRQLKEKHELKSHEASLMASRVEQSTLHQQLSHLKALQESVAQQEELIKKAKETEKSAKARLAEIQQNMKESKSHHERELKAAEEGMSRTKKDAERSTKTFKAKQQAVQAIELEIQELKASIQSQEDQIKAHEDIIMKMSAEVETQSQKEADIRAALNEAKQELEAKRAALKEQNKELHECEAECARTEKERSASGLKLKEADHKIARFHKDSREATHRVEAMLAKYEWIAADRQYFGKANTAYDFGANDPGDVSRRLSNLEEQKEKLAKSVNMRAMNMLGQAEERYNDLMKKKEIVENDKTKIASVISELDQKKNEALQAAWKRVNKDFGSIYSTLLPGATAKLEPPEGQTVLDGLEVRVAFSGVWKDTLTELSGGQRSLVALSLILSLLLFKPAPLYILDEVDAALDLSHTQNIGQMLKSHFRHSQFIIVSLKEGMFNNANVVFRTKFVDGISMVTRHVNPRALAQPEESARKTATVKKSATAAASNPAKKSKKGVQSSA